jgi:hypothetical protein
MSMTESMRNEVDRRVQQISGRDFSANPADGALSVQAANKAPSAAGTGLASPMAIIFLFIIFFFTTRFIIEASSGGEKEAPMHELKISLWNVFAVTVFAIPGIVVFKALSVKFLKETNPLNMVITAA